MGGKKRNTKGGREKGNVSRTGEVKKGSMEGRNKRGKKGEKN